MLAPILILSFNRPQFLRPVLASLRAQGERQLAGREVHLFQDGAVNRYSRIRYAEEAEIDTCVRVFREHFPQGTVHRSAENIGICENFRRAEHYAFRKRDFEVAYFLEDDLVLSPVYLEVMERLGAWAKSMSNVAYFAAYGDYYPQREEIIRRRREVLTLDHHWAFGLFRKHWHSMQPLLEPFYDIVCDNDYHRRDSRRIFSLYERFDAAPRASSQDAAKAFACDRLGLWRANTVVPFAKYIGSVGEHMTPETYADIGFDRTEVAKTIGGDFNYPDAAAVSRLLQQQHALFQTIRASELTAITANLPPRRFDPVRLCDMHDVHAGYRLFLGRQPEAADVADAVGRKSVLQFIAELTESDEYRGDKPSSLKFRPCSREDVIYAYRLCLHRDPETEHLFEEHVGKTDAGVLTRSTWQAPEGQKLRQRVVPVAPIETCETN